MDSLPDSPMAPPSKDQPSPNPSSEEKTPSGRSLPQDDVTPPAKIDLFDYHHPWMNRDWRELPESFLAQSGYDQPKAMKLWMQCLKGGTKHLERQRR